MIVVYCSGPLTVIIRNPVSRLLIGLWFHVRGGVIDVIILLFLRGWRWLFPHVGCVIGRHNLRLGFILGLRLILGFRLGLILGLRLGLRLRLSLGLHFL